MAQLPKHGIPVAIDVLHQWLKDKDWGLKEFQEETFKAAQDLARRRNRKAPRKASIFSLVKRWHTKLQKRQPLRVFEHNHELLQQLGGEASADWFPSLKPDTAQNSADETEYSRTIEQHISSGNVAQRPAQVTRSSDELPPLGDRSREPEFDEIFKDDYLKETYETDFKLAIGAAFTGTNLRRIVRADEKLDHLKHLLDRITSDKALLDDKDCDVKILMHHPQCNEILCRLARMQDEGRDTGDLKLYRANVRENLSVFCLLRAKYGDKIKIKTMNYMPAFGLDLYRYAPTGAGTCYVRMYPLPDPAVDNKDKPIFRLTHRDGYWYQEFRKQFDRHWNGVGTDLPDHSWEIDVEKIKGEFSDELRELLQEVLRGRRTRQIRR
jgi:hypothetical protein